jgi:hypothetical protein
MAARVDRLQDGSVDMVGRLPQDTVLVRGRDDAKISCAGLSSESCGVN